MKLAAALLLVGCVDEPGIVGHTIDIDASGARVPADRRGWRYHAFIPRYDGWRESVDTLGDENGDWALHEAIDGPFLIKITDPLGHHSWIQREGREETIVAPTIGRRDATPLDTSTAQPIQLVVDNLAADSQLLLSVANTGDEARATHDGADWSQAWTWADALGPHLVEPSKGDAMQLYASTAGVLTQTAALALSGDMQPGQTLVAHATMVDVPLGPPVTFTWDTAPWVAAFGDGLADLVVLSGPALEHGARLGPELLDMRFDDRPVSVKTQGVPMLENAWPRMVQLSWDDIVLTVPYTEPFVAPPPPPKVGAISFQRLPDGAGVLDVDGASSMVVELCQGDDILETFTTKSGHLEIPPNLALPGMYFLVKVGPVTASFSIAV